MSEPVEKVVLHIGGDRFDGWEQVELRRSMDTFSTIACTAPFDSSNLDHRELFRPFQYRPLSVEVGRQLQFNGTMPYAPPDSQSDSSNVQISAYALPGVLAQANEPIGAAPFEYNNMTLRQIAERIVEPYGLRVEFIGQPGATGTVEGPQFRRVKLEADQKPADFLTDLAKQLGLVMTDSPSGALVFWQSIRPGKPVARLVGGSPPVNRITATFNAEDYYSEVTGLAKTKAGQEGAGYTERNPRMPDGVVRPLTFKPSDVTAGDLRTAVRAKIARMHANLVAYSVEVVTWRDPQGDLWAPNTTITLLDPRAMIYRETEFIVRDVVFKQDADSQPATLGVMLPGGFSGEQPERFPWDE